MLSANSCLDANQHISILATANSQVTTAMSNMTDRELLDSVKYEPIASLLH